MVAGAGFAVVTGAGAVAGFAVVAGAGAGRAAGT